MQTKKKKKKIVLKVILCILAVIVVFIGILALRAVHLVSATKGEPIARYEHPKSALLVLDVQNDTLNNSQYSNTDTFMININNAITYANKNGLAVIYTKQECTSNPLDFILSFGAYRANSDGSQLSQKLELKSNVVFNKSRNDAFSATEFEEYLLSEQIDTLYLVGADASGCVYRTALGGVNRGYSVNILKDSVFAGNEDILNTMIEKYSEDGIRITTIESFS